MHLAMALAKAGAKEEALNLLEDLEKSPEVTQAAPVEMIPVYWNLGDYQKAMQALQRCYEWHANWMVSLKVDPTWDEMRGEKIFQDLLDAMAFPD